MLLKPLREIASEYGIDRSHLAMLCRQDTLPAERGSRGEFLIDVTAFKAWYKNYRFRDRVGREGRQWHEKEVKELQAGKIPKGRTKLAAKLKRFHSKPA